MDNSASENNSQRGSNTTDGRENKNATKAKTKTKENSSSQNKVELKTKRVPTILFHSAPTPEIVDYFDSNFQGRTLVCNGSYVVPHPLLALDRAVGTPLVDKEMKVFVAGKGHYVPFVDVAANVAANEMTKRRIAGELRPILDAHDAVKFSDVEYNFNRCKHTLEECVSAGDCVVSRCPYASFIHVYDVGPEELYSYLALPPFIVNKVSFVRKAVFLIHSFDPDSNSGSFHNEADWTRKKNDRIEMSVSNGAGGVQSHTYVTNNMQWMSNSPVWLSQDSKRAMSWVRTECGASSIFSVKIIDPKFAKDSLSLDESEEEPQENDGIPSVVFNELLGTWHITCGETISNVADSTFSVLLTMAQRLDRSDPKRWDRFSTQAGILLLKEKINPRHHPSICLAAWTECINAENAVNAKLNLIKPKLDLHANLRKLEGVSILTRLQSLFMRNLDRFLVVVMVVALIFGPLLLLLPALMLYYRSKINTTIITQIVMVCILLMINPYIAILALLFFVFNYTPVAAAATVEPAISTNWSYFYMPLLLCVVLYMIYRKIRNLTPLAVHAPGVRLSKGSKHRRNRRIRKRYSEYCIILFLVVLLMTLFSLKVSANGMEEEMIRDPDEYNPVMFVVGDDQLVMIDRKYQFVENLWIAVANELDKGANIVRVLSENVCGIEGWVALSPFSIVCDNLFANKKILLHKRGYIWTYIIMSIVILCFLPCALGSGHVQSDAEDIMKALPGDRPMFGPEQKLVTTRPSDYIIDYCMATHPQAPLTDELLKDERLKLTRCSVHIPGFGLLDCERKIGMTATGPTLGTHSPIVTCGCAKEQVLSLIKRQYVNSHTEDEILVQEKAWSQDLADWFSISWPLPDSTILKGTWDWVKSLPSGRRTVASAAVDTYHFAYNKLWSRINGFVKIEKLNLLNYDGIKFKIPRWISSRTMQYQTITGPSTKAFGSYLKTIFNYENQTLNSWWPSRNVTLTYVSGFNSEQLGEWFAWAVGCFHDPVISTEDYKRFDSTQGFPSFDNFENPLLFWFMDLTGVVFNRVRMFKNAIVDGMKNFVVTKAGIRFVSNHFPTRKSGDGQTSVANSIKGHFYKVFMFIRRLPTMKAHMAVMGDDSITICERADIQRYHKVLQEEASKRGFVLAPLEVRELSDAEFCSGYFIPSEDGYVFATKPGRALMRMFITTGKLIRKKRAEHARQVAVNMQLNYNHVPVVRCFVRKVLVATGDVTVKDWRPDYYIWATKEHETSDATWQWFEDVYGFNRAEVEECERWINSAPNRLDLELSHPILSKMADVDN